MQDRQRASPRRRGGSLQSTGRGPVLKLLAVTNVKGGVGKTTTAVNLAYLAAREGATTLLWDLDPQGASTYLLRGRPRISGGVRELLRTGDVRSSIRGTDYPRLDLLPADFSLRELDVLLDYEPGRSGFARLIGQLRESYDLVFVDCAAGLSLVAESVYRVADALLIPTIPTVLSLRTLARLLRHVKEFEPRPRALPFFALVDQRKALHRRVCAYAEAHDLGFLRPTIPYASVVEQMSTRRLPLPAFAPICPAAGAHVELWREACARLELPTPDPGPSRRGLRTLLGRVGGQD